MKGLNGKIIKSLGMNLPLLEEQQRIVEIFEHQLPLIQKITTEIKNQLIKFEKLRVSILKSAFEGKLVLQEGKYHGKKTKA